MKQQTLLQKYQAIEKIGTRIEVPYHVWTILGGQKSLEIVGCEVCLGFDLDYANIPQARKAVEWYVTQFGGNVKWSKLTE